MSQRVGSCHLLRKAPPFSLADSFVAPAELGRLKDMQRTHRGDWALGLLLGLSGCDQAKDAPSAEKAAASAAAPVAPEVASAPLPTPSAAPVAAAPAPDPESLVTVTGTANWKGKLVVRCSDANPIAKPMQQPATGIQFRSLPGKDDSGSELILNFHNGYSKTPGEQPMGYFGEGKANASIEIQAKDAERRTSYFAIPEKTRVVLGADLKTATVKGTFGDALNPEITSEVDAQVKCQ
jgi:hypothetical protein